MTDKTLQDRLREHRVILKSGEYDGAQLMAAWCDMVNAANALDAQAERIKALEGALIPDGWKLVPREATIGMCEAAYGGAFDTVKQLDWFKAQWRDYLEAVPEVSNARALLGEK